MLFFQAVLISLLLVWFCLRNFPKIKYDRFGNCSRSDRVYLFPGKI